MELFSIAKAIVKPSNSSNVAELGVIQEISLDFNVEMKELQGQNRYALLTVQGKGTLTGKGSSARINKQVLGALLGAKESTGAKLLFDYVTTVPASPYKVTPVPPSGGTITTDLGVILVGDSELFNKQMTKVTGTPNTGEYTFNNGEYVFATADKDKAVIISYEYSTTTGSTLTLPNPVIGDSYPFQLWAKSVIQGQQAVIKLPNVISGKLSMPLKLGEFTIPDFDLSIFADGAGNIGYIYFSS